MVCCRSCVYWNKSSKKVPIDVVKVIDKKEKLTFKFGDKIVTIPSWKWVPKDPHKLYLVKYMRICFYGKGIIFPWDQCKYYETKYGDKLLCQLTSCEYIDVCPKYRGELITYIT